MLRTLWGDDERFKETYWSRWEGLYFAGDGAKLDDDGDIWLLGRVDDVMNVSGHRLSTTEIESALVSHPKVAEAAVVGAADETTGQAVCAFVILRDSAGDGGEDIVEELRKHVAKEIGAIAKPRQIMVVPELPKTRSGKIMRRLLKDVAEHREVGDVTTLADSTVMDLIKDKEGPRPPPRSDCVLGWPGERLPHADVAVIGGSGFYAFLDDATEHAVATPYGDPSAPIAVGTVAGRSVAFLPAPRPPPRPPAARHQLPRQPVGAALASASARCWRRARSAGCATPSPRATSSCPTSSSTAPTAGSARSSRPAPSTCPSPTPTAPASPRALAGADADVAPAARWWSIEGPRFSTRAESRDYADAGLGPDQHDRRPRGGAGPRAGPCATPRSRWSPTWTPAPRPARASTRTEVFALFRAATSSGSPGCSRGAIAGLPDPAGCTCATWADGIDLTYEVPGR